MRPRRPARRARVAPLVEARAEALIHRSPEAVLEWLADMRREPMWNRGHVRSVVKATDGPIGVGTRFLGDHRGMGPTTWTLTELERGRHVRIEGMVGGAPYAFVGDVEPALAGARLSTWIGWTPRGAWRALRAILPAILRARARRSLRNLKRAMEA